MGHRLYSYIHKKIIFNTPICTKFYDKHRSSNFQPSWKSLALDMCYEPGSNATLNLAHHYSFLTLRFSNVRQRLQLEYLQVPFQMIQYVSIKYDPPAG